MKALILVLFVVALGGSLSAQDCTLTLSAKKAGWVPDTTIAVDSVTGDTLAQTSIGIPKTGDVTIAVTQADSTCEATDQNGLDGNAAVTIPSGDYTVLGRATGKKGGNWTVGEVDLKRGKGKPTWAELPLTGESWLIHNEGGASLQLRVLPVVAEPTDSL